MTVAIRTTQVTVGPAAVELTSSMLLPVGGAALLIRPADDVYIGTADVSGTTGFLVPAGSLFTIDVEDRVYAIRPAGNTIVYLAKRQA